MYNSLKTSCSRSLTRSAYPNVRPTPNFCSVKRRVKEKQAQKNIGEHENGYWLQGAKPAKAGKQNKIISRNYKNWSRWGPRTNVALGCKDKYGKVGRVTIHNQLENWMKGSPCVKLRREDDGALPMGTRYE